MTILIGLLLWLAAGTLGALLARVARPTTAGTEAFTVAWGVLGAFVGGLVGILPYLPLDAFPGRPGAMAGAVGGALALSLLYRLLRRTKPPTRGWVRLVGLLLLGSGAAAAAGATWFVLAVANDRLYRPKYNTGIEPALARACGRGAPLARSCMSALVRVYLSRPENAGIVLGVWVDGARVLVTGGVTSHAHPVPMDANNLFELGSVTKVFTGLALARAVSAGELKLNDRAVDRLPADPAFPELRALPLTLEDLATHYSGLRDRPPALPWSALFHDNPFAGLSERELLASVARSAETLPQTRTYTYSNFDFTLLGAVLERAAGVPFPRLLEERVFRPLGLTRTFAVADSTIPLGLIDGHSLGRRMPHWIGQRFAGAVGVVSCADDLLKLIEAEVRLQPDSLRPALLLASTPRRAAGGRDSVGLGWHIRRDAAGHRFVRHSGFSPGFFAFVGYAPGSRVGVVVLGNSSDPTVQAIGAGLLRVLSDQPPERTATGEFALGGS